MLVNLQVERVDRVVRTWKFSFVWMSFVLLPNGRLGRRGSRRPRRKKKRRKKRWDKGEKKTRRKGRRGSSSWTSRRGS